MLQNYKKCFLFKQKVRKNNIRNHIYVIPFAAQCIFILYTFVALMSLSSTMLLLPVFFILYTLFFSDSDSATAILS